MAWKLANLEAQLLIGSTLVEGSTLSESEARAVYAGKTVFGHPIQEIRELLDYRAAVEWLMLALDASPYLSLDLIQQFHMRLFQSSPGERGRWKSYANYTYRSDGTRFDYAAPSEVGLLMTEWLEQFRVESLGTKHYAAQAAKLYFEFQRIHPFEDGNGRIGRILIAYWLHFKERRDFVFRLRDKKAHLEALEAAGRGNFKPLTEFFKKRTKKS